MMRTTEWPMAGRCRVLPLRPIYHQIDERIEARILSLVHPANGWTSTSAVEQGIARGFAILPCRSGRVRRRVALQVVSGAP